MRLFRSIIIIIFFLIPSILFPQTAEEVINNLIEQFQTIETMKGQLNLTYQTGEVYSGTFIYMNPGKIYIKMTEPPGKVIVTDSKKLWAYDSSTDVCGVQELETAEEESENEDAKKKKEKNENEVKLSGGIAQFLEAYEIISITEESSNYYVELAGEAEKFTEIKIEINSDFLLEKAIFKDKNNEDGCVIELSDIKSGERITPGIFNFDVPANAQVVKNPLDVR